MAETSLQSVEPATLWQVIGTHWEPIVAVAGVFIALCALGLTLWQAHATRRHNRLSVRPSVHWARLTDPDTNVCELLLENNGIGPALIRRCELMVDDEVMSKERLGHVLQEFGHVSVTYVDDGYGMRPNERFWMVRVEGAEEFPAPLDPGVVFGRVGIIVEYESMYGEKFLFKR